MAIVLLQILHTLPHVNNNSNSANTALDKNLWSYFMLFLCDSHNCLNDMVQCVQMCAMCLMCHMSQVMGDVGKQKYGIATAR